MTDINSVVLVGRLTRDLGTDGRDFGYLPNGTARASVSVAVNRSKKTDNGWEDDVSFFDVVIWGKMAENLKPYLLKGKRVAVDGHLKQDRWEKDGRTFQKVVVYADSVQMLDARAKRKDTDFWPPAERDGAEGSGERGAAGHSGGFDEDIPF